ncbi:I78 family peptidase inhibitor [Qipengyuania sp. 902]|uniref:I78 family peptidase inhibitor n=1 Tax=Qipengyuania sp. 902 TaxID=3417565 RepID=UPI003EC11E9C
MRSLFLGVVALPLAACAGTYGEAPGSVPANEAGGECDAQPVQYHIGHEASTEMGATILRESGAQTLRWGPPNSAWTMDYRTDRVNVRYDESRKIIEITCG